MIDVTMALVQLAFVAALLTVALEQVFDTRLYRKYLGKGLDGKGSVYFRDFELRPWISTALGIVLAFVFNIRAIEAGLSAGYLISPDAVCDDARMVDMIVSGIVIGGGTKSIKTIARRIFAAQADIAKVVHSG